MKSFLNRFNIVLKLVNTIFNGSKIVLISGGAAASDAAVRIVSIGIIRPSADLVELG